MNIQQLKLLAARVRELLGQSGKPVNHSQSLDLIAAIPGLRNWPEVQSFPDFVSSCELDLISTGRLAYRLNKRFNTTLRSKNLLELLSPSKSAGPVATTQIWPGGPMPGVYVTTSQNAINALMEQYEEATDGAIIYAERAGCDWESSIDLGEGGLWSKGLERVPSGTLIVIGPVELNQQAWNDSSVRLEMACLSALNSGHRVAVLVETPRPEDVCQDVELMVRTIQPGGDDIHTALSGVVTEDGRLERLQVFAPKWSPLVSAPSAANIEAVPSPVREHLRAELAEVTAGIALFGSSEIEDHPAIELIAAALAMTEHIGPAARVMPRQRGTPAKDWLVPDAIKQLPFLPSIQSAYAQGYRRIIFPAFYTKAETLLDFSRDALLLGGLYGGSVEGAFSRSAGFMDFRTGEKLLSFIVSILGIKVIKTRSGDRYVSDLYLGSSNLRTASGFKHSDVESLLRESRVVQWENEMERLLNSGEITVNAVKKSLSRDAEVQSFLSARSSRKGDRLHDS